MRPFSLLFTLCATLLSAGSAQAQDRTPIELPRDAATPVITFDYLGGGLKRASDEPQMVIQADGTVIVGNPFAIGKRVEGKIPLVEVQALLRFIVREQHFFDFDIEKVKLEIAEEQKKMKGIGIAVGGGSTTVIRVKTAAKEHEARYYALGTYANQYKGVKALAQLSEVEKRLTQVMNVTTAGGAEEMTKLLNQVNEQLKKEYRDAQPLTMNDLQSARWQGADLVVRFFRAGAENGTYVSGTATRPDGSAAKVDVKAKLK